MLTAAVLAGGRSVRMGRDKASLLLDGVPLLKVMTDRAASCADEVLVVGRAGFPGLFASGVRFVPDLGELGGPPSSMRGLHAALTHARGEFVLLLPCDMPFFDVGLVEHMKGLCAEADVVLPCLGGRCEPLCALYRASLAVRAWALLEEGRLRLRALLEGPELRVRLVEEGGYPFAEDAFFNINTPEDYRRALGLRRERNGENGGRT
nr:molybdenum cofactor guanylyltransferase [uncultured Fretibacterium sp.]